MSYQVSPGDPLSPVIAAESMRQVVSRFSARFWPPVLSWYVLGEVVIPFGISLFVFTTVLFLIRSVKLVELVVSKSVPASDIVLLFAYTIPGFLEIAVPMAVLIGVILGFSRLSADSELIVMRASGVRLSQLIIPVLVFSLSVFFAALFLSQWLRPRANEMLETSMYEFAKRRVGAGIVSGAFNELGQLTIYAQTVDSATQALSRVIIGDRSDPESPRTFIAKYGQIVSDDNARQLSLRLFNGSIHEGWGRRYNVTYFDYNNVRLDHDDILGDDKEKGGKKIKEMKREELALGIDKLSKLPQPLGAEDYRRLCKLQVETILRVTIPAACIFVSLLAMALGIQPSRGGNSWGVGVSMTLGVLAIVVYYLATALFTALAEQGSVSPSLALWSPNAIYAVLAIYLFRAIETERWQAIGQALGDVSSSLSRFLRVR